MKNKAEVIKAVETCLFADTSCNNCPYCDITDCVNHVVSDLRAILNKSDFEVVEEILQRSKKRDWLGTGISGEGYTLELLDVFDAPTIDFDGEGNIL